MGLWWKAQRGPQKGLCKLVRSSVGWRLCFCIMSNTLKPGDFCLLAFSLSQVLLLNCISQNLGCWKFWSCLTCCLSLTKRKTRKCMKRRASQGRKKKWERLRERKAPNGLHSPPTGKKALGGEWCWVKHFSLAAPRKNFWPKQPIYCPRQRWRSEEREEVCAVGRRGGQRYVAVG